MCNELHVKEFVPQVRFRNAVVGSDDWENYYTDGNVVAFSRGGLGFFAMIKYGTVTQVCAAGS